MQLTIPLQNSFQLLLKKARKQSLLMVLLLVGFAMNSYAQPGNDDPCNAIPLTPDLTCNFQTFDNTGATSTAGAPAPGCANYQGFDVWFQVVVPPASNGTLVFNTVEGTMTDVGMAIYRGTCDNLQLIACNDDGVAGPSLMPYIINNSLTVGSTIWIRCWEYGGNAFGTFGICVTYPPPPPAYDEPCNATPLPTPTTTCTYQTFTDWGATTTVNAPAPGCANYGGSDVWFSVVVPAGGVLDFDTQAGEVVDGGMAIYRGTCDNLQLIACDDNTSNNANMPEIIQGSLTPGSTIWIRFWSNGLPYNLGTFGICVSIPPPPPANDDPCGAIALPTPTTTCNYQTFTDESATGTSVPDPGCANYSTGDVWFSVVVPAGGALIFDTQTGTAGVTDGGMAIYSGVDCNNLTLIACDDDNSNNGNMPKIIQTGLTPGSTVWIRFWSNGLSNNVGTFGICVSVPPPPPVNDEPCNAILLTASNVCTYHTYTTESSTNTISVPPPVGTGCAGFQGSDVWFKVIVPCDGKIVIDSDDDGVITDGVMAAYRGTCDNLQWIACDDDGSANGAMPRLSLTSLTPGSTIWIRFWEYGGNNNGTFSICASVPPPPPPGGNCLGANSFCSSQTYTYPNSTDVPTLGGGGIYGCLGSTPNPAWYYFQVQTAGSIDILIQQTNTNGQIVDVDFALWGPFPDLPSSCGNLAANNIVDCSYSTSGTETANLPNAAIGDVYVLLITNFSNQPGTVTFYQTGGTGATNCNIVCTLTAGNSGPTCPCGTIDLTASTVVGANYQWNGPNCFNQTGLSTQQNPSGVQVPCESGTYIYTVIATIPGPLGSTCFAQTQVTVTDPPFIGNDTTVYTCAGTPKNMELIYDTTGVTTHWTHYPGGEAVGNPSAADTSGVYLLAVTSNITGCTDTAIVTLVVDTVRATVTSTGNATCTVPGQLTVTNPSGVGSIFEYSISTDPNTYQASNTFTVIPGTYMVNTRDSLGCILTSAPITVNFFDDLLPVSTHTDTTICLNQSVSLTAFSSVPGDSYAWVPTTGLSAPASVTTLASPTDTTLYTVYITYGTCLDSAKVTINVDHNLAVDAGGPLDITAGQSGQANAIVTGSNTNLTSILWSPGAGLSSTSILTPTITPVNPDGSTTYQVTVTNTNGCTATDNLIVNVVPNIGCENLRNAFTPNGDGINDYWLVYDSYSCLNNVTVSVFNRYGSKVFESTDYRNNWDGKYKGKELPDGTYYGIVEYTFRTGKKKTVKTDLTLLR